ncbi:MAG: hypothetical protein EAZ42_07600 [Verrucomicrobia bacterium]|nr:MAG: hypothetical protein EAZ42_07600 [Verrucomicrobiota bacterium]
MNHACLIIGFGLSTIYLLGEESSIHDHGWVHFYEGSEQSGDLPEMKRKSVQAGEMITWWEELEPQEGVYNWSKIENALESWHQAGKKLDVRLATAHHHPFITPQWLFDDYHVRRIGRGLWDDFEGKSSNYECGPSAAVTSDPAWVISGNFSLKTTQESNRPSLILALAKDKPLLANAEYAFEFDYRTDSEHSAIIELSSSATRYSEKFEIELLPGQKMSHGRRIKTANHKDITMRIYAKGEGKLSIDNINLIHLSKQMTNQKCTFDSKDDLDWLLEKGAKWTKQSVIIDGGTQDSMPQLVNHPENFPLISGHGYGFSFRYQANAALALRCQLVLENGSRVVLSEKTYHFHEGDSGQENFYYGSFLGEGTHRFEFTVIGDGKLLLDDVQWIRWSDRVTCFPDYFHPIFIEKWSRMVAAFAERFRDHPALGIVSVGGFGRWEEVILDDDGYGGLDEQWLARGYSQEAYLAHISRCMDLYRKQLGNHALRICLAYGLYHQTNADWIYRRVAQAAVARGIHLKQNGWSEKWDMWNKNTNASYLWNRYRNHPHISLTLETGGHISKGGPGSGHPISFLNRGLIDGTDFMFFYASDLIQPQVDELAPWAQAQLGQPLITNFYCRLTDLSDRYLGSSKLVPHRNAWLGLRLVHPENEPLNYGSDGRYTYLATTHAMRALVFDLDDRQQYNGLSGETLSVEYFDSGDDAFTVSVWDPRKSALQKIGTVEKRNTQTWQLAEFYLPAAFESARNGGANIENDVVLDAGIDGDEKFSNVEIQAVPMREWQKERMHAASATQNFLTLENKLSHEILLSAGEQIDFLEIPIQVNDLAHNGLTARVFAMTANGEIQICQKEYLLPADQDLLELPLQMINGTTRMRIELSEPHGSVGWYLAENNQPAWSAYRLRKSSIPATKTSRAWEIDRPFSGVDLQFTNKQSQVLANVRILKLIDGQKTSAVVAELTAPMLDGVLSLQFPPQGAGHYQFEVNNLGPAQIEQVNAHALIPIKSPRLTNEGGGGTPIPASTQKLNSLQEISKNRATTSYKLTGNNTAIEIMLDNPHSASKEDTLIIPWRNSTCSGLARVLWADQNQSFHEQRSHWIALVQNDTQVRDYTAAIGLSAMWQGSVRKIRIEPATGNTRIGSIEMGPLKIYAP